ncbi:MAG TPA: CDGSH iron-sulfur domain-containing protein [Methylocella sp.]
MLEPVRTEPTMYLCRCGGSSNKPFCDGTHKKIGFSRKHSNDQDRWLRGKELTIHDNGLCARTRGFAPSTHRTTSA